MKEKVSLFIDGDLNDKSCEDTIKQLKNCESSVKSWQTYHLIGDVIRGDVHVSGRCLASKISLKLEQEPTVLAPNKDGNQLKKRSNIWGSVTTLAVAASIIIAVFFVSPWDYSSDPSEVVIAEASNTLNSNSTVVDNKAMQEFSTLLAGHSEYSTSSGFNNLSSYIKLVSAQEIQY